MDDIRWDRDFALEQAGDDENLLRELLTIFAGTVAENRREIEEALPENDRQLMARAAHSIKGSASSLGFWQVADMANTIEEQAREGGDTAEAWQLLAMIKALEAKLPSLA